ncbi:MAG: hypothetical protein R3F42_07225 [Pseudomonadota bacterium]
MSLDNAMLWADSLSYFDPLRSVIWDDWRLPTECQTSTLQIGPACTTAAELSHLFDDYGVSSSTPGLFTNVQPGYYWSTSTITFSIGVFDILFNFETGSAFFDDEPVPHHAWAVRDGDVGAVPIPPTLYTFGAGVLWLFGSAGRKAGTRRTRTT